MVANTCTANTQSFSYAWEANTAGAFSITHVHYDDCYKEVFAEIATVLETTSSIMSDLAGNVDQIKTDINALKVRAESPSLGVVMAPWSWYTDCNGENSRLRKAVFINALKRSGMYEAFEKELQDPTSIPGI